MGMMKNGIMSFLFHNKFFLETAYAAIEITITCSTDPTTVLEIEIKNALVMVLFVKTVL